MSNSVRPHRRQPTGLPRPWDSPGKNTGVGCHFLLQCMKVKSESEVAQLCLTLRNPMDCSLPGSSIHGIFQARVLEWGAIAFSELYTLTTIRKIAFFFLSFPHFTVYFSSQISLTSIFLILRAIFWVIKQTPKASHFTLSQLLEVYSPFESWMTCHWNFYFKYHQPNNICFWFFFVVVYLWFHIITYSLFCFQ